MSYDFEGFFASVVGDRSRLLTDTTRLWPSARAQAIDAPLRGIGAAMILSYYDPLGDAAVLRRAYEQFVGWTATYPEVTFVWIKASCIPTGCSYSGTVIRNGSERGREEGDRALSRLLAHLGVGLPADEYFEPFTRRYFGE